MKLIQFTFQDKPAVGVLEDDVVHHLTDCTTMQEVIALRHTEGSLNFIENMIAKAPKINAAEVKLSAPIIPERNIICVGWNYLKHFDESIGKREQYEVELPDNPTLFSKLPTTVAGPFDELPLHESFTEKLDWEVELAVVIGKEGKNISEDNALDHVFGYCIANDISARDIQRAHGGQWFKGKNYDFTCPLGPWIVPAEHLPDPQDLTLECLVNGHLHQTGYTKQQIFPIHKLISIISTGLTLKPGDIILTGTPDGIGAAQNPPVFLKDGDVLESRITHLGSMKNTIKSGLL